MTKDDEIAITYHRVKVFIRPHHSNGERASTWGSESVAKVLHRVDSESGAGSQFNEVILSSSWFGISTSSSISIIDDELVEFCRNSGGLNYDEVEFQIFDNNNNNNNNKKTSRAYYRWVSHSDLQPKWGMGMEFELFRIPTKRIRWMVDFAGSPDDRCLCDDDSFTVADIGFGQSDCVEICVRGTVCKVRFEEATTNRVFLRRILTGLIWSHLG